VADTQLFLPTSDDPFGEDKHTKGLPPASSTRYGHVTGIKGKGSPFKAEQDLSAEELRRYFEYDAETGILSWKIQKGAAKSGRIARNRCHGHYRVRLNGRLLWVHRVIWCIAYGSWPRHQIDHRNGDRSDNRLVNLREATNQLNQANRKATSGSGFKGVSWHKGAKKWIASITVNRKNIYLGLHETPESAHAAYMDAARQFFGDYASSGVRP
jgi:hypothetical protein